MKLLICLPRQTMLAIGCLWLIMLLPGMAQDQPVVTAPGAPQSASQAAPPFILRSLNGEFYSLDQMLKHGPVVVLFWSVDCVYCRAHLEQYKSFYADHRDQGVQFVAINVGNEPVEKLQQYVNNNGINYPVLSNRLHNLEVAQSYGVEATPTLFLINTDGNLVYSGHRLPPPQLLLNSYEDKSVVVQDESAQKK
jgi:peroxiredoxin